MSKKVLMLKGLPASGKSTEAKELVVTQNYVRINKDDARSMYHCSKFNKGNEGFVLRMRDIALVEAMRAGRSVVIDDTNLNPIHEEKIKKIVDDFNSSIPSDKPNLKYKLEVKFIDTPLDVCLARDAKRENPVGKRVIMGMYNQYLKPQIEPIAHNPLLPDVILCDIDGTIALMNGRGPYDWDKVDTDLPNKNVIQLVNSLWLQNKRIIFVSGRSAVCYRNTLEWIKKHTQDSNPQLIMRFEGDNRKDSIVKQELYERHIKDKYNVSFILDDRQQVVDMWRSLGLTCLQVAEGDF